MVDGDVGGAGDVGKDGGDLVGHLTAFGEVVGINLKGEVAVGAGNLVHDHVDDGLGEACRC